MLFGNCLKPIDKHYTNIVKYKWYLLPINNEGGATFVTLEEAQAEILRLNEELATKKTENENLAKQNDDLTKENTKVRELNQQYFLKLSAQYQPPKANDNDDEDDVPSCEDFAKTLNI